MTKCVQSKAPTVVRRDGIESIDVGLEPTRDSIELVRNNEEVGAVDCKVLPIRGPIRVELLVPLKLGGRRVEVKYVRY